MALTKQPVNINFAKGLDTKTDPYQVALGSFLKLNNSIFNKGGLLQKRNGYDNLPGLPNHNYGYLTTFNNNLVAIGDELSSLSKPIEGWTDSIPFQGLDIDVLSIIKSNTNQSQCDSVVSESGLVCTVFTDQTISSLSTPVYKYVIADYTTGQNVVSPTVINSDATYGVPRVYRLDNYFVIVYITLVSAAYNLNYIAVDIYEPSTVQGPNRISTSIAPSSNGIVFDAVVFNDTVFLAWNGASGTGIKAAFLTGYLGQSGIFNIDPSHTGDIVTITADTVNSVIWISYYNYSGNYLYAAARNINLISVLGPTSLGTPANSVSNLTISASGGILTAIYEIFNNPYSYDSGIPTHYCRYIAINQSGGAVSSATTVLRSVGLASKAFVYDGRIYALYVYQSPYQSTYFLSDVNGNIIGKLAYQNAGGYLTQGLPSALVSGDTVRIAYLYKNLIQAANVNTNVPSGSQVNGIYSQTGINLSSFTFTISTLFSAEIGFNLNITGGFLWAYDGYSLFENGFFLYPDLVEVAGSGTSGSMSAQQYFYQTTYEWSDNQGNLFRSAPSIPVSVTLTSDTSVTINGPTLRLSLKNDNNPVKICIYRWSIAQPVYYQVTSIADPLINDPTVDSFTFTDTLSDASILGNNILYTTGGVLENISPPGFDSVFLFDNRLWGIVSEDKNLLWFSKQVIQNTPVEMSDLQTLYVSPVIGAEGSTGDLTCGASMDDKLVLFKSSAINYINGVGPDITGANNGYSQPIFINSTVGCSSQASIVFQPQGLMFQFTSPSGNQIWLLGRDLSTSYIGAPVQSYLQDAEVIDSISVPGTNQVRFTLSSGIVLMYDYYYGQWGTFSNIPAVSNVLYEGLHTFINSKGQVLQESPGAYLDGANPTLMSFTTSWINLMGLQGYQRAYFFYLLATYLSPHILNVQIAYDYNPAFRQQCLIYPKNWSPNYGNGYSYGNEPVFGGPSNLEQWKVYLTIQRCESFQITISEIFDDSFQTPAGAGFTMSGINLVVGLKKGYRPTKFTQQVGGS
jgi:hypothetical protein